MSGTPPAASKVEAFRESVRLYNEDREEWGATLRNDAVLETAPEWPDGGRFEGRDAIVSFLRKFEEAWSEIRFEIDDAEAVGEAVVAHVRWVVRGTSSAVPTGVAFSAVAMVDERGDLRSAHFFFEHADALEFARGLSG